MKDIGKTAILVVVAVVLCGAAYWLKPAPSTPQFYSDQGEPFYPEFTDPLRPVSLEVVDFDESSGAAKPFKVELKDGVWSIPSHYNYPADGKDRLAKTAAGLIGLHKDIIQSDRTQDHETFGVVDPLDDKSPSLKGRGQRVTLRDAEGRVLADFIFGKPVKGKDGYRYVRLPGKKRTYQVKVDLDISTRFADWIDTNVLDVTATDIKELEIDDYSVDETTGTVDMADQVELKRGADNHWTMAGLPATKKVNQVKVNQMASALSRITITGVRPKPAWLARDLCLKQGLKIDPLGQLALQSKGFFVSRDGRLLSNEGEVHVGNKQGVRYTLRFGEVLFGEGLDVSAGNPDEDQPDKTKPQDETKKGAENRYLFVTAAFDPELLGPKPTPPPGHDPEQASADEATTQPASAPADDQSPEVKAYHQALKKWEERQAAGKKRADELNSRFAAWYYVISGSDFKNIRLDRSKLVQDASPSKPPQAKTPPQRG